MRNWHSLYDVMKLPLQMVLFAVVMCGFGNLIVNQSYGLCAFFTNDVLKMTGQVMQRCGVFLINNFPVMFMISAVIKKGSSGITVLSALIGYIAFLVTTMAAVPATLTSNAYSSIFGLSMTTNTMFSASVTKYPLQTGMVGAIGIALITLFMFNVSKKKSEYGFFSFISKEMSCVIGTAVLSVVYGMAVSFLWPFFVSFIQNIVAFISADTTNPVNMALYGITDRVLNMLNVSALIRQPFWYTVEGGSWMSLTGTSVVGDVNIWTAQVASSSVSSLTGRFITPYYILNIFAMPAMMMAMYSLCKDPVSKARYRGVMTVGILISLVCGSVLPMELMMLLLCPLLLLMHLGVTGILFALLQSLHIYLGYNSSSTTVYSALPGTLPEYISYIGNPSMRSTLLWVLIAGVVTGVIYFLMTRLYFEKMAVDLFQTGELERTVTAVIKGVGGLDNIRTTEATFESLTISLYDPTKLKPARFRSLGIFRIYDTRSGFRLSLGAGSTMIKNEIDKQIRSTIR